MTTITRALVRATLVAGLLAVVLADIMGCGDGSGGGSLPVDAPDALGSFAVGHMQYTAIDPARGDRMLAVHVWYPIDAGEESGVPFVNYDLAGGIGLDSEVAHEGAPVSSRRKQTFVVFSHGYQGISLQSIGLVETLASHGFVVAAPEHTGNSQFSQADSFDQAAANRVPDVVLLFDDMLARNADPGGPFYRRIDDRRYGVVGHSFGGMTAIGVAAGWAGAELDPRVAAIVPISAVIDASLQSDERSGPNAGFTREQLAKITVPTMLMGGSEDVNVFPENNQIAFAQIVNAPRVYKVEIIGANHNHFASVCTFGDLLIGLGLGPEDWPSVGAEALIEPYNATCGEGVFPIAEATRLENLYVVSFFKRHLLNQRGYDRYLSAEFADSEPAIAFAVK